MYDAHGDAPRLLGEVVRPSDQAYDALRAITDTRHDNEPSLILRCAGVADVRAAVNYARESRLPVAVRSSGSSFLGTSSTDGGIVIDLGAMRDVHVDLVSSTVRIRPGARGAEVVAETAPFGLAPVGGLAPTTAYGGVATMSGHNILTYRHGFACNDILSMDVVLADGSWVTASETTNPDLFWAMRGAGESFGIVTSFEMPLHPVPSRVRVGRIAWSLDDAATALAGLGALDETLSEDMLWMATATNFGSADIELGVMYMHLGSDADGARDIAALMALAPVASSSEFTPSYGDLYAPEAMPMQPRVYTAGCDLRALDAASAEMIVDVVRELEAMPAQERAGRDIYMVTYGRGAGRRPRVPGAWNRFEGAHFQAPAWYSDPANDEPHRTWSHETIHRFVDAGLTIDGFNGTIPTWISARADEPTTRRIFGEDGYERLARLKARYDPDELFVGATTIRPAR